MSSRFGRNKRRRAREQLAAAQAMLAQANEAIGELTLAKLVHSQLLHGLRADLDQRDQFLRDVGEIVGRTSILAGQPVKLNYKFERARNSMGRTAPGENSLVVYPEFLFDWRQPIEDAETCTVQTEIMELLDVQVVVDQLRPMMHAYVTMADESVAYGLTHTAIRRMTRAELKAHLQDKVAAELLELLTVRLKGRFGDA
jgi:hypothetical protein